MPVRLHHCQSQEMVAQGLEEPPAKKCTCRKFIPYKEADTLVKNGTARWVVKARERGHQQETCPICGGNKEIKNCAQCGGNGEVSVAVVWDIFNEHEIVSVSQASVDKSEKKYRPSLAMKTPRVATIEVAHIERAYVEGIKAAADRIEEYGELGRQFLAGLVVGFEPEDNRKLGTGRRWDWGRAPFATAPPTPNQPPPEIPFTADSFAPGKNK